MPSPFPLSVTTPGHGTIHLTLLPPSQPSFSTLTYTYPLKLLPSNPHILLAHLPTADSASDIRSSTYHPTSVPLLFLLTYGGGLVAGDHISLTIRLDPQTRLTITTQGSTKIFKPSTQPPPTTRQDLTVRIGTHAALWLAPDPVQPYAESLYAQTQIFEVERGGSVGIVDWVTEGRRSRGESWAFEGWRGKNEIWDVGREEKKRMMVRDAVVLEGRDIKGRMDGMGVFGTVILRGPLFKALGDFFVEEFERLPRIGGRNWGNVAKELTELEKWRAERVRQEKVNEVLWTACHVRGCTVMKFSAKEVEGVKCWLASILRKEGTIGRECGEGGLMFVR